jgi:hypothetical protein
MNAKEKFEQALAETELEDQLIAMRQAIMDAGLLGFWIGLCVRLGQALRRSAPAEALRLAKEFEASNWPEVRDLIRVLKGQV